MAETSVVRARVGEAVKVEAAAVLATMGLSLSDAVQVLLKRVATDKELPFEPLIPIAAMQAAEDGDLITVGTPAQILPNLTRTTSRTNQFKRDFRRAKAGYLGQKLDGLLLDVLEYCGKRRVTRAVSRPRPGWTVGKASRLPPSA